nr:tetratricopeptide repeat protein [uncultured Tolumonas sp.]
MLTTDLQQPSTSEQHLLHGQWLHEQGQLDDAQQCYIHILQQHPRHRIALHLFGISLYQQTRYAESEYVLQQAQELAPDDCDLLSDRGLVLLAKEDYLAALACFERALAIEPAMSAAWNNLGVTYQHLQRLEQAEQCWQQVLALKPEHRDALINLGNLFYEQGKNAEALDLFGQLLQHYPQEAISWRVTAKALSQTGLYEQALHYIQQALQLSPNCTDCLTEQGAILRQLHRYKDAFQCYHQVADMEPNNADADNNCGVILDDLKQHKEAQHYYQQALKKHLRHTDALFNFAVSLEKCGLWEQARQRYQQLTHEQPHHINAWHGLAGVLLKQRRLNNALGCYRRALMLSPNSAELWHDCAIVLRDMQRHWLALSCLWRAIQLRPHFASALNTHGMMLYELRQFDDAQADFKRARELDPNLSETYWNQAHCHLIQGHMLLGWQLYEWRKNWLSENAKQRQWQKPQWRGEAFLPGQTILLHAEQGYGDTIQFCRYVTLVAKRGVRVIFEAPEVLHRLLSELPGIEQIIVRGDNLPAHDWQCSLMSLPLAFATTLTSIPAAAGYLTIPTKRVANSKNPQIGFVWAGNAKHHNDRARSIPLATFQPLLSVLPADYICLQQPLPEHVRQTIAAANVHFPDATPSDFTATAAIIAGLDLVITVDTAVAHLAGAMGKTVWILLAYNNDWRWLTERADSPWYHSARLFRQPVLGDWQSVINEVSQALVQRYAPEII